MASYAWKGGKKMPKAKKLPSGNWRVQLYTGKVDGKRQYRSFTAPTKRAAECLAAEYAAGKRMDRAQGSALTLKEAINAYIDLKSHILSPSTLRGYQIIRDHAFPLLLALPLSALVEPGVIQRQMNQNATHYRAKSLRNQLGLLSAVMAQNECPMPRVSLLPREKRQIPVPTLAEIPQILRALYGAAIEPQALLALTCSLRQSEIAALTAKDITADGAVQISGVRVRGRKGDWCTSHTRRAMPAPVRFPCPNGSGSSRTWHVPGIRMAGCSPCIRTTYESRSNGPSRGPGCFRIPCMLSDTPSPLFCTSRGSLISMSWNWEEWSSESVLRRVYQYTFSDEVGKAKDHVNVFFDSMQHEMQHKKSKNVIKPAFLRFFCGVRIPPGGPMVKTA